MLQFFLLHELVNIVAEHISIKMAETENNLILFICSLFNGVLSNKFFRGG